jgi:hypothetical protein
MDRGRPRRRGGGGDGLHGRRSRADRTEPPGLDSTKGATMDARAARRKQHHRTWLDDVHGLVTHSAERRFGREIGPPQRNVRSPRRDLKRHCGNRFLRHARGHQPGQQNAGGERHVESAANQQSPVREHGFRQAFRQSRATARVYQAALDVTPEAPLADPCDSHPLARSHGIGHAARAKRRTTANARGQ